MGEVEEQELEERGSDDNVSSSSPSSSSYPYSSYPALTDDELARARALLEDSAEQGFPEAQFVLATRLLAQQHRGRNGGAARLRARELLWAAGKQGHPAACFRVACILLRDDPLVDPSERMASAGPPTRERVLAARTWLEEAVARGDYFPARHLLAFHTAFELSLIHISEPTRPY